MNNATSWHTPQRQSPAAILIIMWGVTIRILKGFWPILLLYFFKRETDSEQLSIIAIIAGFGVLTIVGTVITYWFKKIYISEENLVIQSGWLKKKMLSIPFKNIQAVHLEQNIWQQACKVAKVSFDATGSEKVEVKLDALSLEKAEDLKNLLMQPGKNRATLEENIKTQNAVYKLDIGDLIKLSLTANHLEALFILLALGINFLNETREVFNFEQQDYIHSFANQLFTQTAYIIAFLLAGMIFISIVFSFARTFIKFFGFTLTDNHHEWKIAFGLFDKQQKVIPINKIQIISWRANWLRRKIDYWVIHIQAVGHNKQNRKRHLKVPMTAFRQVLSLATSYQPAAPIDPASASKIHPAYWKRKTLFIGLPLALIPTAVAWFWFGNWAFLLLLIFFCACGHYYIGYQNFRFQTVEAGLQMHSGTWGRKFTLLNWNKVQQVHLNQSPYQRRHQLASIVFLTAGGSVTIPYLTLHDATALADQVIYDVESKDENWM